MLSPRTIAPVSYTHLADEEGIRKQIYEILRPHFTSGTARRTTSLLETLRLEAYTPELPIQEDRIHVANGTLFLSGAFCTEKEFCRNRLPIQYDPSAPQPVTWLRFLSDLLEPEDILTLQEYLGYCLIPTNRGQVMMLLKGCLLYTSRWFAANLLRKSYPPWTIMPLSAVIRASG